MAEAPAVWRRLPVLAGVAVVLIAVPLALGFSDRNVAPSATPTEQPMALPGPGAPPEEILGAYLAAFKANDCTTASRVATGVFAQGSGDLCGHVTISSYESPGGAAVDGSVRIYPIKLQVSTGSSDGTIGPGELVWFYSIQSQADGSWKISAAGSGP